MLLISNKSIGANFRRVETGEILKGYYQYLNLTTGEWKISTYSKSENYALPFNGQNYRAPANIFGWLQIMPAVIKKYWKKIFKPKSLY